MKRTVLEIMDYAAAYRGNFLSSMLLLSDELKKRDIETVFVFPERAKERSWSKELSDEGYNVIFVPYSFSKAVKVLRSVFKEHNIISVHSHFLNSNMYIPLKAVSLFRNVPHYFHAHSIAKQAKKNYKTLIRRFLLSANKLLCVSDAVSESYRSLGYRNCVTIKNGICFSRLDEFELIEKKELCFPGKYSVLMFGYDFYIKGIDTAISALDKFDINHDITLCICVASHMETAKEYLENRFGKIPPWIKLLPPRNDVASYMRSADVFLSASRTEGMAYAVLEAAYCKLPLVLSDIEPHKELLLPKARIFPVENDVELYKKLLSSLSSKKTDDNKNYVLNEFSADIWISKMIKLLTE